MEEIQGHTTEEWYAIKPPDIFTSSLRHFHCLTAASQKKKKINKSLFVLDAGFSVATAASRGSGCRTPSLQQPPTAAHRDWPTSSSQNRPFLSLARARTEAIGLV